MLSMVLLVYLMSLLQQVLQVSPQQTAKVSVWDLIDAEIEPLTNEQRNMLANNEEYVNNYNSLQGKKYIGEKYDMQKAHEVCNKFKDKLEEDIEVADVYVAINAQYHDYCKLFEKWFGKGNFDDMIFESAIDFWFDDVDFGEDKLWKYFNELK